MANITKSTTIGKLLQKLKEQTTTEADQYYPSSSLYSIEVDPDTKITSLLEGSYPWREYKYGNQEDADDAVVAQVDCNENGSRFYVALEFLESLVDNVFEFDSEVEADLFIRLICVSCLQQDTYYHA